MSQKRAVKRKRKFWTGQVAAEAAAQYGISAPQDVGEEALSPNQIGSILGLSGEAVKQWIYHRRLPAVRLSNGYWRVRKSDLEQFLRERREAPKRKVLVLGLDAGSAVMLRDVATELGLELIVAHSSLDALLKLREYQPALFIIECSASDYSWEFVEQVRDSRGGKRAPILMIAPKALERRDVDRALSLGIQACLAKPLDAATIKTELKRLLCRYV